VRRPVVLIGAGAVAAVALAVVIVFALTAAPAPSPSARAPAGTPAVARSDTGRPKLPPGPNDPRPKSREPKSPEVSNAWKAEMTEKLRGQEHPGEAAFAAYSDRFIDENLEQAEQQAKAEGLTLPEVRSLTRLGLLVMATQRIPEVEEVLGHELSIETRDALATMVQRENGGFKEAMRGLVARNAPEAQRWELIQSADTRYRAEFFKISGMTADQLDDLLAGNLLLPGAPGATPDPSGIGESSSSLPGPKDSLTPATRPSGGPR
jgi:hypothetical protein